jgi:osmoprotectant transport system substrate-binding protein
MIMRIPILAAMLLATAACSRSASDDPLGGAVAARTNGTDIEIGSADFPESRLLAIIYAQALAARGIKVATHLSIGSREVYIPALLDGSIDLLPEYTGGTLLYLDRNASANTPDQVERRLRQVLPDGVTMLRPSSAEDTMAIVVTRATANRYKLKNISDLAPFASRMALGGPAEWKARRVGEVGFRDVYGLVFRASKSLDTCGPLTLSALVNGQVDVACMISTSPQIKAHDLVWLNDDRKMIPPQNVVPMIASAKASRTTIAILNQVSAALTTADLQGMNRRLDAHDSYEAITHDWLKVHKLD